MFGAACDHFRRGFSTKLSTEIVRQQVIGRTVFVVCGQSGKTAVATPWGFATAP